MDMFEPPPHSTVSSKAAATSIWPTTRSKSNSQNTENTKKEISCLMMSSANTWTDIKTRTSGVTSIPKWKYFGCNSENRYRHHESQHSQPWSFQKEKQLRTLWFGFHDWRKSSGLADRSQYKPLPLNFLSLAHENDTSPHLKYLSVRFTLFRIAIDPIYPPPVNFSPKGLVLKGNCL